jgi:hypothetical protein
MAFKSRYESKELLTLRSLNLRMELADKDAKNIIRLKKALRVNKSLMNFFNNPRELVNFK